jgi:hypothetical protein
MKQVCLIHWNKAEAKHKIERLKAAGYDVLFEPVSPELLQRLRGNPPTAVVIDLSRAPSQGRDVGVALRHYKATRDIPLLFAEGDPVKVAAIKKLLPDAAFTSWSRVRSALKKAITAPLKESPAQPSMMAGYSGTPLPKKLGIKAGTTVILAGAPTGFERTLGEIPKGVTFRRQARGRSDLIIWFAKTCKELENRIERFATMTAKGGLWIAWPKQASGVRTDLTATIVRNTGLANGLVDYKICAIDETWSGLKFARRKAASV